MSDTVSGLENPFNHDLNGGEKGAVGRGQWGGDRGKKRVTRGSSGSSGGVSVYICVWCVCVCVCVCVLNVARGNDLIGIQWRSERRER